MPFHICPEEILLFMMALPIAGQAIHWLRHKLRGGNPCSKLNQEGSCSLAKCEHSDKHFKNFTSVEKH
jgi:hypothetical protein